MLGIMFTGCYYLSYRNALKKLQQAEKQQELNLLLDDEKQQSEQMFSALTGVSNADIGPHSHLADGQAAKNQTVADSQPDELIEKNNTEEADAANEDDDASVEANFIQESLIQPNTRVLVESYEVTTGEFNVVEQKPDSVLVGMTREELISYLARQLEGMSVSEYEKGFYANELITFSEDKVIIRRSYNAERVNFRYYLAIKNDEVIVYYSDKKTVFEYTGIKAMELEEETRLQLLQGIQVETADELFSLLESYSS